MRRRADPGREAAAKAAAAPPRARSAESGPARRPGPADATADRTPNLLLLATLLLVVTRGVMCVMQPLASEDAYIVFRYARSLVAGHGLVFNPGERVMGFTSLPWTLWCALGIAAHVDPVLWTRLTSIGADVATLWLGWRMLVPVAGAAGTSVFAVGFAGWPLFAAGAASGLEVNAFLSATVLAAWLAGRGSRAAGPALGLAVLMRPEGLAAGLALALGSRRRAWLEAILLVAVAWGALGLYYGSPIPQSAMAKAQLYGTPGPWAGRHWWEWLLPFPLGRFPLVGEGQHLLPFALVLLVAVGRGAIALRPAWRSPVACAAAAGLVVWLGYAVFGVAYFWWYLVMPMGGFLLLAAMGLPQLVRGRAILAAAALAVLGTWSVALPLYIGRAQAEALAFAPVATLLQSRGEPAQSVLVEPIGLIGWRSGMRVLDESGLVSPEILARRLRGAGWYSDVVRLRRPEWLVVRSEVIESGQAFAGAGAPFRSAAERDSMLASYRLERAAQPGRGAFLAVYRRGPGSAAVPAN